MFLTFICQQHASYLVKHTTLSLVIVILNRAQNAVQCLASSEDTAEDLANTTDAPLVQQFREEVVKALPDVNTFISLRQNLVSGKTKGESQGEGLCRVFVCLSLCSSSSPIPSHNWQIFISTKKIQKKITVRNRPLIQL